MHKDIPTESRISRQMSCKWLLVVCWIIGLVLGIASSAGADNSFFLLMRSCDISSVSIVGLLITSLPFLFIALAVFLSAPVLLMPTVLCKAFAYGYCMFGIVLAYKNAAWLVQLLLMWADTCSVVLLMWLWFRPWNPEKKPGADIAVAMVIALLFKVLDICFISPFAALLL